MNPLTKNFLENWYGYGNANNDFWVIGPEPGGRAEELDKRLHAWSTLDKRHLVDAERFHHLIGEKRWFGYEVKLQPTWKKILIAYLSYRGLSLSEINLITTQRIAFGSAHRRGISKIYLSPLSSPRMSQWDYDFITREELQENIIPDRIEKIGNGLNGMRNIIVLMLGTTMESQYKALAAGKNLAVSYKKNFEDITILDNHKAQFAHDEKRNNLWVITKHPMAQGLPIDYWKNLGRRFLFKE